MVGMQVYSNELLLAHLARRCISTITIHHINFIIIVYALRNWQCLCTFLTSFTSLWLLEQQQRKEDFGKKKCEMKAFDLVPF